MQENLHDGTNEGSHHIEPTGLELSVGPNHPPAGADNSPTATQAADNSPASASPSNTNKGVVNPATNNSGGYDRPIRTRAPPIRYGDARRHQALELHHSRKESKNDYTTVCSNKRKTIESTAMVNQDDSQPIKVQDDQLTTMTEVLRAIPQLVNTLHTSILYISDIFANFNMRHFTGRSNTTSNKPTTELGESKLHCDTLAKSSAPGSSLHCQSTHKALRVAYKDLDKISTIAGLKSCTIYVFTSFNILVA